MSNNFDNVVEWQKAVTLDLCVDVLALSAGGQQIYKARVVQQQTISVKPISL